MTLRFQYVLDSDYFTKSPMNLFALKILTGVDLAFIQLVLLTKERYLRSGAVYDGVERNLETCPYLVVKEKNNNLDFFNNMKSLASTLKKE